MGLAQLSDDELITQIRQNQPLRGGNAAFETLWMRHAAYVDSLLQRMQRHIPSGVDPQSFLDEARQQTSLNLQRRIHGYRGLDCFRQYLSEVVRSAVLDRRRVMLRTLRHEQIEADVSDVPDAPAFRSHLFFPRPQEVVASKERKALVGSSSRGQAVL